MRALKHDQPVHDPARIASAALQGFFNLAQRWGLTAAQERTLLGSPPESTFFKWKAERTARRLGRDVLDRISYLLGIYKALNILLPSPRAADEWVRKPNAAPLFEGQSALDRMLGGSVVDIADVRRYLEHCADQRLRTLGIAPRYGSDNPFAFMALQDVQEFANFFERRVAAYQVAVDGDVAFDQSF